MARSPRKTVNLSASIHQQLNMYALAASSAGVSLLALAQPAEGKVVYTPANVTLGRKPFALDLDHNGVIDFYLVLGAYGFRESSTVTSYVRACHKPYAGRDPYRVCTSSSSATNWRNAVRINPRNGFARALHAGAVIQNGDAFRNKVPGLMGSRRFRTYKTAQTWIGPWVNGGKGVKNRYLGLKFIINGRYHFGWARLTVVTTPKNGFSATLTGYAYETIPRNPIVAGQTKGTDSDVEMPEESRTTPAGEPVTLGALALGAPGLAIWRREELVAAELNHS